MIKLTTNLEKFILFSFILLVISHISFSIIAGSSYTLTRILTSFSLDILAVYLIFNSLSIKNVIPLKWFYLLFLYVVLQGIFSSFIDTKFEFFQHMLITTTLFIFALNLIGLHHLRNKMSIKKFLIIASLLFGFILISIAIYSIYNNLSLLTTIEKFFDNRRFFNNIQTLMTPILLYLFFVVKRYELKSLLLLLIIFDIFLVFITGARGTLYSLLFASLFIFFTSDLIIKKKFLFIYFLFIVIFFIQHFFLNSYMLEITHSNNFSTLNSSGRFEIWMVMLEHMLKIEHFFSAIGFASQDVAVTGFYHPHNLFFFLFLGSGTFGAFVFLYLFIQYFKSVYQKYRRADNLLFKMLFLSFVAIFIHSLLCGVYLTPVVAIFIFPFIAIFNKVVYRTSDTASTTDTISAEVTTSYKYLNIGIKVLLLLAVLFNIYLIKKNLDLYLHYNKIEHKTNVPGIFMFNESIYIKKI